MLSSNRNIEKCYKPSLEKFESLLDTFVSLKKIIKVTFKDKPWITPGLETSISIKNQFLSKFIKLKDPCKKGSPHKIYSIQKRF